MSTPYDPYPNEGSSQENSGEGLPPYPGAGSGQPYGYPSYGNYGPTIGAGSNHEGADGQLMTTTNGVIDYPAAFSWGFKATFRNWYIWILGTILLIVVPVLLIVAVQFLSPGGLSANRQVAESNWYGTGSSLLWALLAPFLFTGLLYQVDRERMRIEGFWTNIRYLHVLATRILSGLFEGLVLLVMAGIGFGIVGVQTQSPGVSLGGALIGAFLCLLLLLFAQPLYLFWPWVAADRTIGVWESLKVAFEAGKRNYWRIVGWEILLAFLLFFGCLLTFMIGAVILLPAYYLIRAHAYRQAVGGPIPVPGGPYGNGPASYNPGAAY